MDKNAFLIGSFLTVMFFMAALSHIRENTKIENDIKTKMDEETAKWLVRLAWSRTLQLLAALVCAIVIFINYDIELTINRNNLDMITAEVEKRDKVDMELAAEQAKIKITPQQVDSKQITQPAPSPQPAPAAAQQLPVNQTYIATLVPQQQVPSPQHPSNEMLQSDLKQQPMGNPAIASPNGTIPIAQLLNPEAGDSGQISNATAGAPASSRLNANNETIEALYNPEKDPTDKQSSLDDIKKRYEDIMVIHLFLKKCDRVKPEDLSIITNAMAQETTAADAPEKFEDDIMIAARGSYNEIYAKSPCTSKGVDVLNTQYNNYLKILTDTFPQG